MMEDADSVRRRLDQVAPAIVIPNSDGHVWQSIHKRDDYSVTPVIDDAPPATCWPGRPNARPRQQKTEMSARA